MTLVIPGRSQLQSIVEKAQVARGVYARWTHNKSLFTDVPKQCLDRLLDAWALLRRLDCPHDSQGLTPHFEELAACRRSLGDAPRITHAEKHQIATRVIAYVTQLRDEAQALLEKPRW
jgi:hypothetical protein